VPASITGFRITSSGRKGSDARLSHHANAVVSISDMPTSPRMMGDVQGYRMPPDVSAMRKSVAATIIIAAPIRSS
jgi:hypothetical protein